MSLLAAFTVKVSAILLLALAGALCLRTRSAAARHWVLAIGVVSACVAPAVHVLPIPPVAQVALVGPLSWSGCVPTFPSRRRKMPVGSGWRLGRSVQGPGPADPDPRGRPSRPAMSSAAGR